MKVKTLLNKPEKWVKYFLERNGRYCLKGALEYCYGYGTKKEYQAAKKKIQVAINEISSLRRVKWAANPDIVRFNDNPKTTFKDIKNVLKIANV